MKIKIIEKYVDKYTKEFFYPDELIDCSNERGKELIAAGKAEEIKTTKVKSAEK